MNGFGGEWTRIKMDIVLKYARAYLQIMKKYHWKTMYFDGFAGSGNIENQSFSGEGVAARILGINEPVPFDMYYFVELNSHNADVLEKRINTQFPDKKNVHIVRDDCGTRKKQYQNLILCRYDMKDRLPYGYCITMKPPRSVSR